VHSLTPPPRHRYLHRRRQSPSSYQSRYRSVQSYPCLVLPRSSSLAFWELLKKSFQNVAVPLLPLTCNPDLPIPIPAQYALYAAFPGGPADAVQRANTLGYRPRFASPLVFTDYSLLFYCSPLTCCSYWYLGSSFNIPASSCSSPRSGSTSSASSAPSSLSHLLLLPLSYPFGNWRFRGVDRVAPYRFLGINRSKSDAVRLPPSCPRSIHHSAHISSTFRPIAGFPLMRYERPHGDADDVCHLPPVTAESH
jgi:hypothetical protein